jgi:hypothetical protein
MTTLTNTTTQAILTSFDKGQGNTIDLAQKYDFDGLTLDYLNGTYQLQFKSEEHLKAYFIMLFNKDIKDRSVENLDKLFKHLNSGTYLSLNHADSNGTVSVDKYASYKTLFESLGITECRSNGKGSKLVQLIIAEPNEGTVTALINEGFNNLSPLLDGFTVIGLKCELPKQD